MSDTRNTTQSESIPGYAGKNVPIVGSTNLVDVFTTEVAPILQQFDDPVTFLREWAGYLPLLQQHTGETLCMVAKSPTTIAWTGNFVKQYGSAMAAGNIGARSGT